MTSIAIVYRRGTVRGSGSSKCSPWSNRSPSPISSCARSWSGVDGDPEDDDDLEDDEDEEDLVIFGDEDEDDDANDFEDDEDDDEDEDDEDQMTKGETLGLLALGIGAVYVLSKAAAPRPVAPLTLPSRRGR
jgi:hypothetical protein